MLNTARMSTKQKLEAIYVEKKEILSPSGNYRMVETPSGCFGVGEVKRWMMNNPNICLAIPEERNAFIFRLRSLAIVRTCSETVLGGLFTARLWIVNHNGETQKSFSPDRWHKGKQYAVGDISIGVYYTLWERV